MHTQDVSNPQQRRDARIDAAGLHVLIRLPAHPRGEEHMLLVRSWRSRSTRIRSPMACRR